MIWLDGSAKLVAAQVVEEEDKEYEESAAAHFQLLQKCCGSGSHMQHLTASAVMLRKEEDSIKNKIRFYGIQRQIIFVTQLLHEKQEKVSSS